MKNFLLIFLGNKVTATYFCWQFFLLTGSTRQVFADTFSSMQSYCDMFLLTLYFKKTGLLPQVVADKFSVKPSYRDMFFLQKHFWKQGYCDMFCWQYFLKNKVSPTCYSRQWQRGKLLGRVYADIFFGKEVIATFADDISWKQSYCDMLFFLTVFFETK